MNNDQHPKAYVLTDPQLNEIRALLDTAGNLLHAPIPFLPKGEIRDAAQKSINEWMGRVDEINEELDDLEELS